MAINNDPHIHQQVICANVFVRKDDKYLVLMRSPLKKYAPNVVHPIGGKVDPSENPYTAAEREVLEEAGIRIKNLRLEAVLLEITPVKDEPYNWLIFHFSADYDSGEVQETEEGELLWLSDEEIVNQPLFPSVTPVIKHILDKEEGTVFATFKYDEEKQNIIKSKIDLCVIA